MHKRVPLTRCSDLPGYSDKCAICPFCGKVNDGLSAETHCPHIVMWKRYGTGLVAIFWDGQREILSPKAGLAHG